MIRNPFRRNKGLSCHAVMEVLQSYLDGETDVETARQVATHLVECRDCDTESNVYRRIKTSLASASAPLDPKVLASLRQFSERLVVTELD